MSWYALQFQFFLRFISLEKYAKAQENGTCTWYRDSFDALLALSED